MMLEQAADGAGRRPLAYVLAFLTLLSASCGAPAESGPSAAALGAGGAASAGGSDSGESGSSGAAPTPNPLGRLPCRAPAGVSASPRNTAEAIQLLNALPKPTSVACFVESLARPLTVYATSSVVSAQPALSAASPRVFIRLGRLWLSVVMDGDSSYLMEFGELVFSEQPRSVKGELLLPVTAAVLPSAPYDRVQLSEGTVCGFCHYGERHQEGSEFANAFSSVSFRPRPESRVAIDALRLESQTCDWQLEPHRCEMLGALFGGGEVDETSFPDGMVTFF